MWFIFFIYIIPSNSPCLICIVIIIININYLFQSSYLSFQSYFVMIQAFYSDPNYEAYLEICLRNGFLIDKEIPWRIFCDIRQKIVEDKINKNYISRKECRKEVEQAYKNGEMDLIKEVAQKFQDPNFISFIEKKLGQDI